MLIELLLFASLRLLRSQEIQYPFTITRDKYLTTQDLFDNYLIGTVCIGEPRKCLRMGFSIRTYFIWVCVKERLDRLYDSKASSSFVDLDKRQLLDTQETTIVGMMANETVYVNNYSTPRAMRIVYTRERVCEEREIDGEVGLNSFDLLHYSPKKLSFLDQANIINVAYPNAIGISYHTNHTGVITFGVNNNAIRHPMASRLKTSASTAKYFNSILDYIKFNDEVIVTNTYMLFRFENKPSVFPLKIYEELRRHLVPALFLGHSCEEVTDDPHYFYFLCEKDFDKSHFIPLNFAFSNNDTYSMDLSNQFMPFGEGDKELFGLIGTKGVNNQIELGDIFLRNFYIVLERTNHTMMLLPKRYEEEVKGSLVECKEVASASSSSVRMVILKAAQILFVAISIGLIGYILIVIRKKRRKEGREFLFN